MIVAMAFLLQIAAAASTLRVPATASSCAAELAAAGVPLAFPGDAQFANATLVNDGAFDNFPPPFVVLPQTEVHLASALACAARAGGRVAIKGGGHSSAGYSTLADGGIFTVALENLTLPGGGFVAWADPDRSVIRVSGGGRWEDVYAFLDATSPPRVAVGGLCPTVGLGGYLQGGGVGALTRKHGLGSDSVIAARVVLANGSGVVAASPELNADLFFALRGGGGSNWGVISEYTLKTHAAASHYTFTHACFAATRDLAAFLVPVLISLPREVNADTVINDRPGQVCVWAIVAAAALDAAVILRPLLKATPRPVAVDTHTFSSLWSLLQFYGAKKGYVEFDSPWSARSCFVNASAAANAGFAAALMAPFIGPMNVSDACDLTILHAGGAIGDIAQDGTAFPWRDGILLPYMACSWAAGDSAGEAEAARGLELFASALGPFGCDETAYVNFEDRALSAADATRLNFGPNLARLQEIKATWAPAGQTPLRFPHEIL